MPVWAQSGARGGVEHLLSIRASLAHLATCKYLKRCVYGATVGLVRRLPLIPIEAHFTESLYDEVGRLLALVVVSCAAGVNQGARERQGVLLRIPF